ncbi:Dipeptidyl peptidase, partial [Phytophthora palmivora]
MHSGSAEPTGDAAQEDHRYPFAGAANPKRRLGIIKLPQEGHDIPTPVWMDFAAVNSDPDFYISRVNWLPDKSLGVQRLNRLQTEVTFLRFDVQTGQATTLIQETNDVWLNTNYLFRNIEAESKNTFRFLWPSERSGFMHLYLYEYTAGAPGARLLGAVTSGKWSVESVEGIDLAQGRVYFCGTADSPLERHLYVASLFPTSEPPLPPTRLTGAEGMHSIVMDSSCHMFVDVYSNTTPCFNLLLPTELTKFIEPVSPVSAYLDAIFQEMQDSAESLTTQQE